MPPPPGSDEIRVVRTQRFTGKLSTSYDEAGEDEYVEESSSDDDSLPLE